MVAKTATACPAGCPSFTSVTRMVGGVVSGAGWMVTVCGIVELVLPATSLASA
jgi:hypothetical protein